MLQFSANVIARPKAVAIWFPGPLVPGREIFDMVPCFTVGTPYMASAVFPTPNLRKSIRTVFSIAAPHRKRRPATRNF